MIATSGVSFASPGAVWASSYPTASADPVFGGSVSVGVSYYTPLTTSTLLLNTGAAASSTTTPTTTTSSTIVTPQRTLPVALLVMATSVNPMKATVSGPLSIWTTVPTLAVPMLNAALAQIGKLR